MYKPTLTVAALWSSDADADHCMAHALRQAVDGLCRNITGLARHATTEFFSRTVPQLPDRPDHAMTEVCRFDWGRVWLAETGELLPLLFDPSQPGAQDNWKHNGLWEDHPVLPILEGLENLLAEAHKAARERSHREDERDALHETLQRLYNMSTPYGAQ